MSLYFGSFVTNVSTLMIVSAIVFIAYTTAKHRQIPYWGRKIALLSIFGLVLCCFAAIRDAYYLSVQFSFDSSVTAGRFAIDSIQSGLCCMGGAIIAFASISGMFVRNQRYRKAMFFLLSATILAKIVIIEISRWMVV